MSIAHYPAITMVPFFKKIHFLFSHYFNYFVKNKCNKENNILMKPHSYGANFCMASNSKCLRMKSLMTGFVHIFKTKIYL